MARALKVFSTAAGFVNAVVAAPSQKAALEAWGVHENLFATGVAKLVDDPELIARALAAPGEILRVPIASDEGFVAAAKPVAGTGARAKRDPSPPAKPAGARGGKPPARLAPKPPPPPDRGPLTRAEEVLRAAEAQRREELAGLDDEQRSLEKRRAEAERRLDARTSEATEALARAKAAYEAAGGRPG